MTNTIWETKTYKEYRSNAQKMFDMTKNNLPREITNKYHDVLALIQVAAKKGFWRCSISLGHKFYSKYGVESIFNLLRYDGFQFDKNNSCDAKLDEIIVFWNNPQLITEKKDENNNGHKIFKRTN